MKKPVLSFVLAASLTPVWAAEPVPAIDKLVACSDVQDSSQRLSCFDREIAPLARAKSAAPPVSAARPTPGPPASAAVAAPVMPAASAGVAPSLGQEQLDNKLKPPKSEAELILHATIASIRQVAPGAWLVSLDNGQAWRHEDLAQGSYLRVGEAVTIGKAAMGSYRLTRDAGEAKNWIRVTRIR
ncbi:MAG: hypothetical protein ABI645_13910 [Pseudomonadota bacterium]